jgi:hypothetical protein
MTALQHKCYSIINCFSYGTLPSAKPQNTSGWEQAFWLGFWYRSMRDDRVSVSGRAAVQAIGVTGLLSLAATLSNRGVRTAGAGARHSSTVRNLLTRGM